MTPIKGRSMTTLDPQAEWQKIKSRCHDDDGDYEWCHFCGPKPGYEELDEVWHKEGCPLQTFNAYLAAAPIDAPAGGDAPRMFPIQDGPDIPWSVIAPCESQALKNHDQSLERLAHRLGLGVSEAIAVLQCRKWRDLRGEMTHEDQIDLLLSIVARRSTPDHTELVREARQKAIGARSWAKMQPRGSEEQRDADSDAELYDRLADALEGKGSS